MDSQDESVYDRIDPFLVQKWTHAFFTFFDLNRNGVIDWPDFEDLIEVIGEARGKKSDVYLTAKLCLPDIWHKLCEAMGRDANDQLTVSEWHEMWAKTLDDDSEPPWQKAYLDYMFKLLDASGDKLVDQAEYVQVLGFFGVSPEVAIRCFDQFGTNLTGDLVNCIDYKKFLQLWAEFFRSTDKAAPGNFLLGVLD